MPMVRNLFLYFRRYFEVVFFCFFIDFWRKIPLIRLLVFYISFWETIWLFVYEKIRFLDIFPIVDNALLQTEENINWKITDFIKKHIILLIKIGGNWVITRIKISNQNIIPCFRSFFWTCSKNMKCVKYLIKKPNETVDFFYT